MAVFNSPFMIKDVIVTPLKSWPDERGWLIEIFRHDNVPKEYWPEMGYVSLTHPLIVRGPHEHVAQTDLFAFIGPSTFRLHLWDNRPASPTFGEKMELEVGENNPTAVIVPTGVVHGYQNIGDRDGVVMNFANKLYKGWDKKEEVDEIRHEIDPNSKFRI